LLLNPQVQNAQYATFLAEITAVENVAQLKLIYPALEKDLTKYKFSKTLVFEETAEDYRLLTKPYIDSIPTESKEWIYNIIEGKKEVDRVIYSDNNPETGFVVVLDWNWSGTSASDLHIMAICNRRDLSTIRDLNGSHVPLLKMMKETTEKVIKTKYNLDSSQVLSYVHYQPSYYHFHMHFSHVESNSGTNVGKAVSVCQIISCLECNPDYFQRATLLFSIKDNQELANIFSTKKKVM